MTTTSVGMRCPECSKQKTKVRTAATLTGPPQLTYVLIAINLVAFVATAAGLLEGPVRGGLYENAKGALNGPEIADGEWWRVISSGFLHSGLLHIAFNMYFLYFLGSLLEPAIGKLRFGIIYFVSLAAGSFGALLLSPQDFTVGASGAVFGTMGAAILMMRARGIDPMQSGLGVTLLLNLAITFLIPNIAIGGHLGGLAAGFLVGYLMFDLAERRRLAPNLVYGVSIVLGIALVIAAVVVAAPAPGVG